MITANEAWSFIVDPMNRETFSWIGGGLIAIGGGVWAALKKWSGNGDEVVEEEKTEKQKNVINTRADRGAISAGGNITRDTGNRTTTVTGVTGWQLVAVVAILAGLMLLLAPFFGNNVLATNGGTAIGGDVSNSAIDGVTK